MADTPTAEEEKARREKDKQLKLFKEYREAGGVISNFKEWLESFQPTIEEEGLYNVYLSGGGRLPLKDWIFTQPTAAEDVANHALLRNFNVFLNSEIAKGYDIELAGAEYDDLYDSLYGLGTHEGAPKTVGALPGVTGKIRTFLTGLQEEERKRIEQETADYVQQQVDIAKQEMLLPLGQQGDASQQMWAAQNQVQALERQLSVVPDYLQPVIQSQIRLLQTAQSQIYDTERTRLRMETTRDVPVGEGESRTEEAGSFSRQVAEKEGLTLGQVVTAGRDYLQNPSKEEYKSLSLEQKQDLAHVGMEASPSGGRTEPVRGKLLPDWTSPKWKDLTPEEQAWNNNENNKAMADPGYVPQPLPAKPFEPPRVQDIKTTGGMTWRSWFENRYRPITSEFGEMPEEERTQKSWKELLERRKAELKSRFYQQSYWERGERPQVFQKRIRTVKF